MNNIEYIRGLFKSKLLNEVFVTDKTGVKTIEIVGAQFIADEPAIFGEPNDDWHRRELEWYLTMSLNVNDIPPPIPAIWKQVATKDGRINSNYGWAILSAENGSQYYHVVQELRKNPFSRRAQMIYTRPSMHYDYNKDGMSDFMCCSNTTHVIRDGKLTSMVYFRSNDAVHGYKGDFAWMNFVHLMLAKDLEVPAGDIIWHSASFHIYERHFHLL